ncbi:MAG: arabinan endo-1,5-alpha-L-arabinosidase [Fimbriimonadaceae bacterium]
MDGGGAEYLLAATAMEGHAAVLGLRPTLMAALLGISSMATITLPQLEQRPSLATGDSTFSAFPYDGYVPEGGVGIHDPAVIEVGGRYFCFNTGPGFCTVRSSPDLMHWKIEGPILPETPAWLRSTSPGHRSIWAPEAVRIGTELRVYYCASARFGHNESWIGVAECRNFDALHPTKGWHDLGLIIGSRDGQDNFNAIDPSVLIDPNARQWLVFGSYWSGIYSAELDPATGKLKDPSPAGRTLVATNPADRANGIEAPCRIFRDGYYYLFVNYGLAAQGVKSTYRIVVGRSKNPEGPFVDSTGKPMTEGGHEDVLSASSPMFGPGGGVEFQDSTGRWLMSFHYYDGRKFWHGHVWGVPTLQVRELLWTADGWPAPGLPITPETIALAAHPVSSPVGDWLQQVDFGWVAPLSIHADGTCTLGKTEYGTWTLSGNHLQFRWPKVGLPGDTWIDDVQVASGGHYFVGRNQARAVIRGVRQERG